MFIKPIGLMQPGPPGLASIYRRFPGLAWGAELTNRFGAGGFYIVDGKVVDEATFSTTLPANEPTDAGLTVTSGAPVALQGSGPIPFPGYSIPGIFFADFIAAGSGTNRSIFSIGTDSSNFFDLRCTAANVHQLIMLTGGVTQVNIGGGTVVDGTTYRVAAGLQTNMVVFALNGTQVGATDTTATIPAATTAWLANFNGNEQAGGEVLRLGFIPGAFTAAGVEAVSA